MSKLDEFLAHKINDCIKNNVQVTESLLKLFKNEFNVIRQKSITEQGKEIERKIIEYRKNRDISFKEIPRTVELKSKDESYFTESEMLIGYVAPTYEELSKEEKKMYNE